MSRLAQSLHTQWTVVYALVLREMHTRYANSRLGYVIAIVEPVFTMTILSLILYYVRGRHTRHGMPMVLFVVTGYVIWYAFRHIAIGVSTSMRQRSMLMIPQVTVLDIILARGILSWFTYTWVTIVISAGAVFFTGYSPPHDNGLVVFCMSLGLWLGWAFGILIGVATKYWPVLDYAVSPMFRAGVYASGTLFTAEDVPHWVRPYLAWNPMFHITDMMREAWLPHYVSPIASTPYVVLWGIGLTVSALAIERGTRYFKFS